MANDNHTDIGENRIYKMTQAVSWFAIMTFWFSLSYLPLIFFFIFFRTSLDNIVWYLVGLIPLGPAFGSLISSGMYLAETDDFSSAGKTFRKYYRKNFVDSLKVWIPYLFILYLFFVNINYYFNIVESNFVLGSIFIFLIIILTLNFIPVFLIQMKFKFRYKDLIKLGFYYFVARPKRTIGNLALMIIVISLWIFVSSWTLLLIPTVFTYVLVLYNTEIIEDVNKRFIEED